MCRAALFLLVVRSLYTTVLGKWGMTPPEMPTQCSLLRDSPSLCVEEYRSGALHTVVLGLGDEGPLQANTTYFYQAGDVSDGETFRFTTSPPPGSFPYRLVSRACTLTAIVLAVPGAWPRSLGPLLAASMGRGATSRCSAPEHGSLAAHCCSL